MTCASMRMVFFLQGVGVGEAGGQCVDGVRGSSGESVV